MYKITQEFILNTKTDIFVVADEIKNLSALGLYSYMYAQSKLYFYFHELCDNFNMPYSEFKNETYDLNKIIFLDSIQYLLDNKYLTLV